MHSINFLKEVEIISKRKKQNISQNNVGKNFIEILKKEKETTNTTIQETIDRVSTVKESLT